ncbi:hypothetical protein VTI74DRAFT_1399 [Chaetomium olivicolor]
MAVFILSKESLRCPPRNQGSLSPHGRSVLQSPLCEGNLCVLVLVTHVSTAPERKLASALQPSCLALPRWLSTKHKRQQRRVNKQDMERWPKNASNC